MPDFLDKLMRDLLEQFRGKPNIEIFQKALARQLTEVYRFLEQLNTLRWLQTASSVQLDGIGDIVVLSRREALEISNMLGNNVPMEDELYRRYLLFKIHLNTSNSEYQDVYRAMTMFWDKSALYYSEELDWPATIFFDTPELTPDIDTGPLFLAPRVKAAGVQLIIRATTVTPGPPVNIRMGGRFDKIEIKKLPPFTRFAEYVQPIKVHSMRLSIEITKLPQMPIQPIEHTIKGAIAAAAVETTKLPPVIFGAEFEIAPKAITVQKSIEETTLPPFEEESQ